MAQSHSTSLPPEQEKPRPALVALFVLQPMLKSTEVGLNVHCEDSEASFNEDIAF